MLDPERDLSLLYYGVAVLYGMLLCIIFSSLCIKIL